MKNSVQNPRVDHFALVCVKINFHLNRKSENSRRTIQKSRVVDFQRASFGKNNIEKFKKNSKLQDEFLEFFVCQKFVCFNFFSDENSLSIRLLNYLIE